MSFGVARIRKSVKVIADKEAGYGYHGSCGKAALIQASLFLLIIDAGKCLSVRLAADDESPCARHCVIKV